MQKNMETEQLNGILALNQQKKTFCDRQASKEYVKKLRFSETLKVSSVIN